jgi:hypothetical protein
MRWIFSLIRLGIFTVLVCVVSVVTTWYVVQSYVDALLAQLNISTPEQKLQLSKMISDLSRMAGLARPVQTAQGAGSKETSAIAPEGRNTAGDSLGNAPGERDIPQTGAKTGGKSQQADDSAALPVWSQSKAAEQRVREDDKEKKVVISAEDFNRQREQLSEDDKSKVFSVLVTRLPQEEILKISEMVENGITGQELDQLQAMLTKYLPPEEYNELLDIINKY